MLSNHKLRPLSFQENSVLFYILLLFFSHLLKQKRALMEALKFSSFPFTTTNPINLPKPQSKKLKPITSHQKIGSPSLHNNKKLVFSICKSLSSSLSTELTDPSEKNPETDEKFDWYAQWYPIMPVCDLDKRAPHGKKVMGIDIVVWWDRNESAWKVFDDMCPHRLAPLSEGRIDQWGRLQCVYHGWCFNGSGDCKFIPQAPPDGPPVHTFKKACAAVYPSIEQNGMVWFWPNSDPQYKDILSKKKPPYIAELDDPSYTRTMGNRDLPYGYEVSIENLMDPAHVHYAHYGLMRVPRPKDSVKADREGGHPIEFTVEDINIDGFIARRGWGMSKFMAPCIFASFFPGPAGPSKRSASSAGTKEGSSKVAQQRFLLIFICIPVSPGTCRLIWSFPRNFNLWIDQIIPRWMFHVPRNLIFDSDMYLLHVEERKIMEAGPSNWQNVCFVPTKSDATVTAFRRWLNKYSSGQVNWGPKFTGALLPTPPREQLLDRYWSHVVNCRSCNLAYKSLTTLEVVLQVFSVAAIGIVAANKQNLISVAQRNALVCIALLCFVGSRWVSHYAYKSFRFHDYNHAYR